MIWKISQMFYEVCDICNPVTTVKRWFVGFQNASAAPSRTNQLWNVDTIGWESRDITTQPGEIYNRKS